MPGRRRPPNRPSAEAIAQDVGRWVSELWQYVQSAYSGLSAPHADTHLPESGADPLTVDTPVSIGMTNAAGGSDAFADAEHVHATPLTTKGDLLTVSGGALARLGVGTDTHVLTADSSLAPGLKWATTAAVTHEVLSATHTDTLTGTVVRGDLIAGNSTPKWSRLPIGTTGKFLRTDGNDPSWQALALSDLPSASGFSVLGKATTGAGDRADIVAADETVLGRTAAGNVAFASLATGQITNAAVTYAKIQDVSAASRLLGRGSAAGSGDVEEISLGDGLTMSSTTLTTKRRTVMLGSDVSNSTASLADATGLSFSVAANTNYQFEFYVVFQTSSTSHGIRLDMNGPSSPTQIVYDMQIFTTASAASHLFAIAYDGAGGGTASVGTANSDTSAFIRGILRNGSNSGTLIVRFVKVGIGGSATIKTGSMGWINEVS